MSQTKIIALIAGVVVVAGAGFFFLKPSAPAENADSQQVAQESNGKKIPFSEFIKQGGSYKCTVHQYVAETDTVGTTYISDGKVRGEYNTKVQGMSIDSTLIVRDGYTYTWTSMAPTMGYKVKVVESASSDTSAGMSGTYSYNANQIGDYECETWSGDVSKFELPSGVNFQEM